MFHFCQPQAADIFEYSVTNAAAKTGIVDMQHRTYTSRQFQSLSLRVLFQVLDKKCPYTDYAELYYDPRQSLYMPGMW